MRARRSLVIAMAVLLASVAVAETVATRERARLRQGPSAATELLGELEPDTKLELLGESGGWRQVRTPDGRVGYVWGDHLAGHEAEQRAPAPPNAGGALADDVRELRNEVTALRERPEPATSADLEHVREELERLTAAERDLARRLDDRSLTAPLPDPPGDGTAAFAPALLFVGALVGYAGSRFVQRRRDRRQRNRLRL